MIIALAVQAITQLKDLMILIWNAPVIQLMGILFLLLIYKYFLAFSIIKYKCALLVIQYAKRVLMLLTYASRAGLDFQEKLL